MVNSEEFKEILDPNDLTVGELTKIVGESSITGPGHDEVAGNVIVWDRYIFIVAQEEGLESPMMRELLERRGGGGGA